MATQVFKKGQRVIYVSGSHGNHCNNPHYPYSPVAGTVDQLAPACDDYHVFWDNDLSNSYYARDLAPAPDPMYFVGQVYTQYSDEDSIVVPQFTIREIAPRRLTLRSKRGTHIGRATDVKDPHNITYYEMCVLFANDEWAEYYGVVLQQEAAVCTK